MVKVDRVCRKVLVLAKESLGFSHSREIAALRRGAEYLGNNSGAPKL